MFSRFKPCVACLAVLLLAVAFAAGASQGSQSWDFSVLLDGDEIGYHRFELTDLGDQHQIRSEAKFDVRFLFVNAFRYRHSNTEVWSDGCLRAIDSETEANRKRLSVTGARSGDAFIVDDGKEESALDTCVMTFAYWNPVFLQQSRLLNAQSGEYLDVEVEALGSELIKVRGETVPAEAYRVTARNMEITLWYSSADEWLALESVAKGGRVIRYELT